MSAGGRWQRQQVVAREGDSVSRWQRQQVIATVIALRGIIEQARCVSLPRHAPASGAPPPLPQGCELFKSWRSLAEIWPLTKLPVSKGLALRKHRLTVPLPGPRSSCFLSPSPSIDPFYWRGLWASPARRLLERSPFSGPIVR